MNPANSTDVRKKQWRKVIWILPTCTVPLPRHTSFQPRNCLHSITVVHRLRFSTDSFIFDTNSPLFVDNKKKKLLIVSPPQRLDSSNSFQITQIIVNWRLTWARRAHEENWFSSTFFPSSFAGKSDFRFSTKSLSRVKWFMNELGSLFSCFVSFRLPLNGICRDES